MATAVSSQFANTAEPTDGILGFAYGAQLAAGCQGDGHCGSVYTIAQAIGRDPEYFSNTPPVSFFLTPDEDVTSRLVIGDPDPELYQDELQYVPVNYPHNFFGDPGMWYVKMAKISIGSGSENWGAHNNLNPDAAYALIDTGTSFIGVPDAIYDDLLKAITADRTDCHKQRDETFKCGDSWAGGKGLRSLSFFFQTSDGQTNNFTLDGSDIVIPDATIGIMKASIGCSNCWILGDTFINKHYVVFDESGQMGSAGHKQIGFAKATVFEGAKFLFVVMILFGLLSAFAAAYFGFRCYGWLKTRRTTSTTNTSRSLSNNGNLRNHRQQMLDARQQQFSNMSVGL